MSYELWAMLSYELWAMSYELWAMSYELSELVLVSELVSELVVLS